MVVFMGYDSEKYYEYIDLFRKNITKIPKDWNIKCKELYLGLNKITKIPKDWKPQCKELYLGHNQIKKIPKEWNPRCKKILLDLNTIISKNLKK